jgi:AcrR family transcriptional regulator
MSTRMQPEDRRDAIVDAALTVMLHKGMATTTVRDVAGQMGTSSGLIHHYFPTMDEVLAAAFDRAASEDLQLTTAALRGCDDPVDELVAFLGSYGRADQDWAFQLWLDAWAEASRRPAVQIISQRLNLGWQRLLADTIHRGVSSGAFRCEDADATAWRILSLLDGLALQAVAHRELVDHATAIRWSATAAETELGLSPGSLSARVARADGPDVTGPEVGPTAGPTAGPTTPVRRGGPPRRA